MHLDMENPHIHKLIFFKNIFIFFISVDLTD